MLPKWGQSMRGGTWVDISDDLSPFRQSVKDINADKKPVWGVEVGSGGLAIRGLAPVVSPAGEHLGSVETLVPFNPLMESLGSGKGENTLLYMSSQVIRQYKIVANNTAFLQRNTATGHW